MKKVLIFLLWIISTQGFTMTLTLSSTAFSNSAEIPSRFTCHGADVSPPLSWKDAPSKTKSFVLMVEDPDAPAGTWTHWILFNIPSTISKLEEATTVPNGAMVGLNSWGNMRYQGPCPPSGTHRYYFKLYALNITLPLPKNTYAITIIEALKTHVLDQAELIGLYTHR